MNWHTLRVLVSIALALFICLAATFGVAVNAYNTAKDYALTTLGYTLETLSQEDAPDSLIITRLNAFTKGSGSFTTAAGAAVSEGDELLFRCREILCFSDTFGEFYVTLDDIMDADGIYEMHKLYAGTRGQGYKEGYVRGEISGQQISPAYLRMGSWLFCDDGGGERSGYPFYNGSLSTRVTYSASEGTVARLERTQALAESLAHEKEEFTEFSFRRGSLHYTLRRQVEAPDGTRWVTASGEAPVLAESAKALIPLYICAAIALTVRLILLHRRKTREFYGY